MKTVRHYDTIRIDQVTETPQGFLKIPMLAARTGIQTYRTADGGKLNEFRPPDEVFSKGTMDSFRNAPITNDHPQEFVTAHNAKELMVGLTIGDVVKSDNKFIGTDGLVTDAKTIQDVKDGKVEISAGYSVDLDFTPGEFEGKKFDAVQRNIRINHIAIVDRGRAGPRVRLRVDSEDAVVEDLYRSEPKGDQMIKVKIGDKEYEVSQQVADALKAAQEKVDADTGTLEGERDELKKQLDAAAKKGAEGGVSQKEMDTLQAKHDAVSEELKALKDGKGEGKTDAVDINKAVRDRTLLQDTARRLIPGDKLDEALKKDNKGLKIACINADSPDVDLSEKSEAYVDARYDVLAEKTDTSASSNKILGGQVFNMRKDAGNEDKADWQKKREADAKETKDAWQKSLGQSKSS